MTELCVTLLLNTQTVALRDVVCNGECQHKSAEECAVATHLVFPYRGVYVRHVGSIDAVAEANQVLFFNQQESYRISHPVTGGDACLSLAISEPWLVELVPKERTCESSNLLFRLQRLRIDPRAQALVALLRHSLTRGLAETLQEILFFPGAVRTIWPECCRTSAESGEFPRRSCSFRRNIPTRLLPKHGCYGKGEPGVQLLAARRTESNY